jgi:hypothetical protein
MSDHAKKSLKKSKPASPDILPSNASIDEKRSYNIRALQHQVDMKSFELAMVELKVLASNKAYNYSRSLGSCLCLMLKETWTSRRI